jgi:transcriptional regulator with XRE-family HTH domain
MYTFPELIRKIRDKAELTQAEFAEALGISTILVTMIETGKKEVSKKLLVKLAEKMNVHPASITPFLFINEGYSFKNPSTTERLLIKWGEKMQNLLIEDRALLLKKYVKTP